MMRTFFWPLLLLLLTPVAGAEEFRLDAHALYQSAVTSDLRIHDHGEWIELESGTLYEDDGPAAGYSYQPNEEVLSDQVWIRKQLIIPHPEARQATLLIGRGGDLEVSINDREAELASPERVGNYWQAFQIDPSLLKAGVNTIVVRGNGKVWIARVEDFSAGSRSRTEHPNRSAKSSDGGKTWDDRRLGLEGNIDGEYYIRLFLDQNCRVGKLLLPVVDLGNLSAGAVAPPLKSVGPVSASVDIDLPAGTSYSLFARRGTTYVPNKSTWTRWQELTPTADQTFELSSSKWRYLQLRIELLTTDQLASPQLRGLTITSAPTLANDWTSALKINDAHNEPIVRTSIPFEYESFAHPKLKKLRRDYRLDEVVSGAKDELEILSRLTVWSSSRWSTLGHLKQFYPEWDALQILAPFDDGTPVGGFCQQYNLVFLQACQSLGLTGRIVSLGPGNMTKRIRGGHETVEIWSNQFKKWIYIDGNTAWYAVDRASGVPLSILELRERQLAIFSGSNPPPIRIVKLAKTRYQWEGLDSWPALMEVRLVPRNNFLSQRAPLPLNQGMRGWFWTGHYVWNDKQLPARRLYGHRVCKRDNFQWTLNQAHYYLEATDTPGELLVHLDTETPGFDTFLASIDGNELTTTESVFRWILHSGENRLKVLSRNRAGKNGIVSWISLQRQHEH